MSDFEEPWREQPQAVCPECGVEIDLDDCGHRVEGAAEAPDGLPAPILVSVCKKCEANPNDS